MVKVYDIPADIFIKKVVEELKKDSKIQPPTWAQFVKTGSHTERIPQNKDWWYVRCASLLRKVYIHGPIGLSDLKSAYGGRLQLGYALAHHRDAAGAIIRKGLQQLEAAGYVTKVNGRGRILTKEGMKKLDGLGKQIHKELIKISPELKRYA
ncbi:MAG: small subunit ribosomal protein S19e [Candidatus Nitrosomirales archaeon]|jgi:small subunit ribosomal protein S19e